MASGRLCARCVCQKSLRFIFLEELDCPKFVFFRNFVLLNGTLVGSQLFDYGQVRTIDAPGWSELVRWMACWSERFERRKHGFFDRNDAADPPRRDDASKFILGGRIDLRMAD
jgi:hypothetical protein